jgi:diaminopimelate decarboxylase
VGNAGVLLTEVQYLKPGDSKNFCIVDAAMNDLVRPAMYQAWMAHRALPPRAAPLCSGTWWARCANRATGWAATVRWRCSRR